MYWRVVFDLISGIGLETLLLKDNMLPSEHCGHGRKERKEVGELYCHHDGLTPFLGIGKSYLVKFLRCPVRFQATTECPKTLSCFEV